MTKLALPDLPDDITRQLDTSLPLIGEAFRDGRIDESIALLDDA